MKFELYFRNLTQEVYSYVLRQAGWQSLTEFELEARFADSFTFHASNQLKGLCSPEAPEWDTREIRYKTFSLSLHHLRKNVRNYILQYLGFHTYVDYMVTYGANDTFFVHVPCRDDVVWEDEADEEDDYEENESSACDNDDNTVKQQYSPHSNEAMNYASQLVGNALMKSPPSIERIAPPPPPALFDDKDGEHRGITQVPSVVRDSYFGALDDYDTMDDLETQQFGLLTPKQCPDDIRNM